MKLLFAGDCVIRRDNNIQISSKLKNYIISHDFRICNFEAPIICDSDKAINKIGPHVKNSCNAPKILADFGFNVACLANNHIMDYGKSALENTIEQLNKNGFKTCGAGFDYEKVYSPLKLSKGKENIYLFNACQAEFGCLKNQNASSGYVWIDSPKFKKLLSETAKNDNVIIFAHAGLEENCFPLPEFCDIYKNLSDLSNNSFVVACHPHIIQGYEKYNNAEIIYSLGNFSFWTDSKKDDLEWNRGLLYSFDTNLKKSEIIRISTKNGIIDFDNEESFSNDLTYRSSILKDRFVLEKLADELAEKLWDEYYKSYYQMCIELKDISKMSFSSIVRFCLKRIFYKITKKKTIEQTNINESFLLHNLQIETHRFIVSRYLYNKNLKDNLFND